jgi:SAM-dependent methyltransferase
VSYEPREFWEQRLAQQFDLRGTGETGLSLAYNRACYRLRRKVLTRVLKQRRFDPRGKRVLDVGCGTGFYTQYYIARGAEVTGLDIAPTAIERLRARFPAAHFMLADVSEVALEERFDLVNAFDVLYHITDDAKWERALGTLGQAVAPGGLLLLTDTFPPQFQPLRLAEHNRMRPLESYVTLLRPAGLRPGRVIPTHVLLNRELGRFRFLNRAPWLLYAVDRVLLTIGLGHDAAVSKLLVARRSG